MSRDQLLAALQAERLNTDWWTTPTPKPQPTRAPASPQATAARIANLTHARTARQAYTADRLADIRWMAEHGETFHSVAARLGIQPSSLERRLLRRGANDLLKQLRHQGKAAA